VNDFTKGVTATSGLACRHTLCVHLPVVTCCPTILENFLDKADAVALYAESYYDAPLEFTIEDVQLSYKSKVR